MRNILNLFSLKEKYEYEIILIGYVKLVYIKYYNFKQLNCVLRFCYFKSILVLFINSFEDLYSSTDYLLDCSRIIFLIYC